VKAILALAVREAGCWAPATVPVRPKAAEVRPLHSLRAWLGKGPLLAPPHSSAADGAGVTDKSPVPWPCQMPGTSVLLSEEKF